MIDKETYIKYLNEILHQHKHIYQLKEKLTGIKELASNDWGSSQYASVLSMFKLLLLLSYYYDNVFEVVKINISVNNINKNYLQDINNELNEIGLNKKKINSIDQAFIRKKEMGSDLWSTTTFIFSTIYPKHILKTNQKGFKRMDSNLIGIYCYILYINRFVKNLDSFADFNT